MSVISFKKKIWVCVLLGLACSEPFLVNRQDLIEPRILGVQASSGNLHVQVWNGVGAFHENLPIVEWYDQEGVKFADGVLVDNSSNVNEGMIHYITPEGKLLKAAFVVEEIDNSFEIQKYTMNNLTDYSIESRSDLDYSPVALEVDSENLRLVSILDDTQTVRWMASHGVGTILELDNHVTDFIGKDIVFDRSEILSEDEIESSYVSLFALAIDSLGKTQWEWVDVWYGTGIRLHHSNRYLPIDFSIDEPTEISVVVNSDDSVFGFRFSEPMMDFAVQPLSCSPDDGPFQWWWVELGVCLVGDIEGQRILLEVVW
jgi:hypothetical protein